jgi:hypothetical protein
MNKINNKMELFKSKQLEISPEDYIKISFESNEAKEIFNSKRKEGFTTYEILTNIIEHLWESDWAHLWEEYEDSGQMTFFDFSIGKTQFKFCDFEGSFCFNNNEIFGYAENDKYNSRLTKKLKTKVKKYILDNQYQFELLINQQIK